MFQARLAKASEFKKAIKAVREVCTQVALVVDNTGLTFFYTSATVVARLEIPPAMCEEFYVDAPMLLGVHLSSLLLALNLAGPNDHLTLKAAVDNDCLTVLLESSFKDVAFSLKLVDCPGTDLGTPDHSFQAKITTKSHWLSSAVLNLASISDVLGLIVSRKGLELKIEGNDIGGFISLDRTASELKVTTSKKLKLSVALGLLSRVLRGDCLDHKVFLGINEDAPILIRFKFQLGSLEFYVAPSLD
jgi:proliferating cell nuclear antigen PCNA